MPLVQCTVERRADPLALSAPTAQTRFAHGPAGPPLLYFLTPISFVSQQQPTSKKEGDDPQPSAASRTLVVIISQWQPLPLRPSWCTFQGRRCPPAHACSQYKHPHRCNDERRSGGEYVPTFGALAATSDARLPPGQSTLPRRVAQEAGKMVGSDSLENAASNFASRFALPW